jgi:hypothetical protein
LHVIGPHYFNCLGATATLQHLPGHWCLWPWSSQFLVLCEVTGYSISNSVTRASFAVIGCTMRRWGWHLGMRGYIYICIITPCIPKIKNEWLFIHSFIYLHSIDHRDVEFVIKYKYKYNQNIKLNTIHVSMGHRFKTFLYISTPTRDEPKALYNLIQVSHSNNQH